MVGVVQTQMIDASPGKTGSALILLLRGMGGGSLTDYNNNPKQQQTQSVKCWIYSPLCATTCQQEHPLSESRV